MMNPLCVNINNTFSWKIIIFSEANFKKGNECRCFTFLHISLMFDLIEDSWILIWAYAIVLLRHIASFFFLFKVCLAPAQLPQLCPIPCNLMDCSPPDSSVHEIFQVRILEWVTMPSSGIFLTHRSNPCLLGLLNCRQILYPLSHLGSPGLELRTTFTHPVCGIWGDS